MPYNLIEHLQTKYTQIWSLSSPVSLNNLATCIAGHVFPPRRETLRPGDHVIIIAVISTNESSGRDWSLVRWLRGLKRRAVGVEHSSSTGGCWGWVHACPHEGDKTGAMWPLCHYTHTSSCSPSIPWKEDASRQLSSHSLGSEWYALSIGPNILLIHHGILSSMISCPLNSLALRL